MFHLFFNFFYLGYSVQVRAFYSDGRSALSCQTVAVFATDFVTPTFLRDLYGIPQNLHVQHPSNNQAVTEFLEQYYDPVDLTTYLDLMGKKITIKKREQVVL